MAMITLTLLSLSVFLVYLIGTGLRYGIQPSISDNYYVSHHPWTFTLAMLTIAFTIAPVMITIAPEDAQFLGFLAASGISFVGVAAAYKEGITNEVHTIGAALSALASVIWAYALCPPVATIAILAAVYVALFVRNKIYWMEVTAFLMVYIICLIKLV